MPKLWNATIDAHRREVREAILDSTAALVFEHGLRAVTMSQIAEQTGIGRATLYKYFPDVETILRAWHGRQIAAHLHQLGEIRDQSGGPGQRLEAVLTAYALSSYRTRSQHDGETASFLHRSEHLADPQHQLHDLIQQLLADAGQAGELRDDVAPDELASYCLHALGAASALPSEAAVRRLVAVTLAGLTSRPG